MPVSTYRLQLGADLTLDDVATRAGYYADLGVTHLYLSPVLTAAPGSTHGYDVVDHSEISPVLGGREALDRLRVEAEAHGLGMIVDIVPNHMAVPTPAWHNHELWSVLAEGPDSPYANWFDVDWSAGEGALLMPVLGDRIGAVLARGDLSLDRMVVPGRQDEGEVDVLRYFDHVFPVRAETVALPLAELVDRQHYRLAFWRVADEELNYRRFFDVGTLAAVRVEDPEVFDASHELILDARRRTARSTGCGSTTPTASPTRPGTSPVSTRSPAAPGSRSRRSSPARRSCRPTGTRSGRPATSPCGGCSRPSSTRAAPRRSPRSCTASPATPRTACRSSSTQAKREIVDGALYAEVHRLTELAGEHLPRRPAPARPHLARARGVPHRAPRRVRPVPRLRGARRGGAPRQRRGDARRGARSRAAG